MYVKFLYTKRNIRKLEKYINPTQYYIFDYDEFTHILILIADRTHSCKWSINNAVEVIKKTIPFRTMIIISDNEPVEDEICCELL